jgi:hypothetical protein
MEVHHHAHTPRKKWTHYLWEFLMLFLAVFCGFLAENQREHYIENIRAREYAHSLLIDIINDTIELNNTITMYQKNIRLLDTLLQIRRSKKIKEIPDNLFYYYGNPALNSGRISFNETTLQQVKSSGNLRYFRNQKLKEKIGEYDNLTNTYRLRQEIELIYAQQLMEFRLNLFDDEIRDKFNRSDLERRLIAAEKAELLSKDETLILRFFNFCNIRKTTWESRIKINLDPILTTARSLIGEIKKEYHF